MKKIIKSYAKINIGLNVYKERTDGYHDLNMIMCPIDLYDELTFTDSDIVTVETDKFVCLEKDNLCYKVAYYLKTRFNVKKGINIYIKKNIPEKGGLGGGSSNAATVLKFLNKYWDLRLGVKALSRIGMKFGCDIPYFMYSTLSIVEKRGEKVTKIKRNRLFFDNKIALIIPEWNISTKEAFALSSVYSDEKFKLLKKNILSNDYWKYAFNDLEIAVEHIKNGCVYDIKNKSIKCGCSSCVMTGSGSTFVAYFNNDNDIKHFVKNIKDELVNSQIIISSLKRHSY